MRQKRPFKVGEGLEYRVSRLFIQLGYFVRRGREIYTVGNLDTATDLDVLAVRYTDPLRREVQIAECKSGGDGPLDRLFWLSGVKRYVDASRATLIRAATKWNIKDFASEVGVEILDLPRLEQLEHSYAVDPHLWLGVSDHDFFLSKADDWNRAIVRNAVTLEVFQTLAGEVRFHEPFGGINFLLHHLRALTRDFKEQRYASESLTRFLIAESIAQLAMFIMRIAEMTIGLSRADRDGFVEKGMTYGHMDKPFIDRIFRNAKQITVQMVKHNTGRDVRVDDTFFQMPKPPNIDGIQAIVGQLVGRPDLAATLGPIVDLLLCERFVKSREGVDWLPKIFPYTNLRERIGIVQEYLATLRGMEAVPEAVLGPKKGAPPTSSGPVVSDRSVSGTPREENGQAPGEESRSSVAGPGGDSGDRTRLKEASLFEERE